MTKKRPEGRANPTEVEVQPGRRKFLRRTLIAGASLSFYGYNLAGAYAAPQSKSGSSTVKNSLPSYYPDNYQSIIDASKKETGLAIYSNMATYNWRPIINGFQKRYPWIKKITTNNLGSSEVFERYFSESATGTSPASLMVSGDPPDWIRFSKRHDAALDYASPELGHLPDFAQPLPNIYTFSTDPILMGFNTALLPKEKRPTSIKKLIELISQDSKLFSDKITTYDISVSFGFAINYNWVKRTQNGWQELEKILPLVRPERSSGPMVSKIITGEYLAGYFMSSTVVFPQAEKSAGILGWSYIEDGTPMFMRGMAIPKTSPQANSAKLMLDYLLSHDGQIRISEGGFTPYRPDLTKNEAARTYQSIEASIGKDNMIIVGYADITDAQEKQFKDRWNKTLKG